MALDKQKILNELGSVVNQLQSADCGCMGKLFSNSDTRPPSCCGGVSGGQNVRSCCDYRNNASSGHPKYNSLCAGEPCTGVRRCMGYCNPPKLYADTYNYLQHNMMQPTIQEVYEDLKSINPTNTVMNNPIGAQMGLSPQNQGNVHPQNLMTGNQNAMIPNMGHTPLSRPRFCNAHMNQPNNQQMGLELGHMDPGTGQDGRGMGQPGKEIAYTGHMGHAMDPGLNCMVHPDRGMGNMCQKMIHSGGMGSCMGPQIARMMGNARTNNMPNQIVPPPSATSYMPDMGQTVPSMHGDTNPEGYYPGYMQKNAGLTETNNMVHEDPRMHPKKDDAMPGNMRNPRSHQMGYINTNPQLPHSHHYGDRHMQKMLINNSKTGSTGNTSPVMQRNAVISAENAEYASIAPPNQHITNLAPDHQNFPQHPESTPMQINQVPHVTLSEAPTIDQHKKTQQISPQVQNQWQEQHPPFGQFQHLEANPSSTLPTVYEGASDPNATKSRPPGPDHMYRELILPADKSRNLLHSHHFKPQRYFECTNTGQPIDMTPVKHAVEVINKPQTLSPQPPPTGFSTVKSTVSKTALVGNRAIGKTPSRSQLQQVYNQYKGSQSYTQQNISPSPRNSSISEGHINVPQNILHQKSLEKIERHGGDTTHNDQMRQMGQVEDLAVGKKLHEDFAMPNTRNAKLRNGLQDQVYTTYPSSAKWSFHGPTNTSYTPGYRIKNKG